MCPTLQTFSKEKHRLLLLLLLSSWVCFSLMTPASSPSSSLRSNEPATPTHATHPSQNCSTTAPPAQLLHSDKNGVSISWPARTWPGLTQPLYELPGVFTSLLQQIQVITKSQRAPCAAETSWMGPAASCMFGDHQVNNPNPGSPLVSTTACFLPLPSAQNASEMVKEGNRRLG